MMRAKMEVTSVSDGGNKSVENIAMQAVTSSNKPYGPQGENEDNTYARYTPSGTLTLSITNPNLIGKFKIGQKFYLDFTEADTQPVAESPRSK
jgi:hypothetical protein